MGWTKVGVTEKSVIVAVAVWVTEFSCWGTVTLKHKNRAFMAVILRKGGGGNGHFGTSERTIWRKATAGGYRPLLWEQHCDSVCCTGISAQCSIYRGVSAARFVALTLAKQTGRVPARAGWLHPLLCVYRCSSREAFEQAAGEPYEPQKGTQEILFTLYKW